MSLEPYYHEAQVKVGDEDLRLVVNMRTLDAIESLVGQPIPSIIPYLISGATPYGLLGKFVWGLLREHHPHVSLDQAAGIALGDDRVGAAVGLAISDLLLKSGLVKIPEKGEEKPKGPNPRRRRGASKPS